MERNVEKPYVEANRVLSDLVKSVENKLSASRLYGGYLYGSLATSGFDVDVSDIDVLFITTDDIAESDIEMLSDLHTQFTQKHPDWNDRIDVEYFSKEAISNFKTKDSSIAIISPGQPFHLSKAGRDWMQNWYDVQENGRTLYGPSARTVIPEITKEEFIEAVKRYTGEILGRTPNDRWSQAYYALTMCRALYSCQTGARISKQEAAQWAQEKFPEWKELISQALEVRLSMKKDQYINKNQIWEEASRFVKFMSDQVLATN